MTWASSGSAFSSSPPSVPWAGLLSSHSEGTDKLVCGFPWTDNRDQLIFLSCRFCWLVCLFHLQSRNDDTSFLKELCAPSMVPDARKALREHTHRVFFTAYLEEHLYSAQKAAVQYSGKSVDLEKMQDSVLVTTCVM